MRGHGERGVRARTAPSRGPTALYREQRKPHGENADTNCPAVSEYFAPQFLSIQNPSENRVRSFDLFRNIFLVFERKCEKYALQRCFEIDSFERPNN